MCNLFTKHCIIHICMCIEMYCRHSQMAWARLKAPYGSVIQVASSEYLICCTLTATPSQRTRNMSMHSRSPRLHIISWRRCRNTREVYMISNGRGTKSSLARMTSQCARGTVKLICSFSSMLGIPILCED